MNYSFSCSRLICYVNCSVRALRIYNQCQYQTQSGVLLNTQRFISTKSEKGDSFTVSYLMNPCGFSPESAKYACRYVQLKSSDRADTVIELFKSLGFSKTQISRLTQRFPQVLSIDSQKILKPKVDFFYSVGMSRPDVAMALSSNPHILGRSLERQIVPCFEFLKELLSSNDKAICAIKLFTEILRSDYQSRLVANVAILQNQYGVPQSSITLLLTHLPKVASLKSDRFKEVADAVLGMGINPQKTGFVIGIYVKGVMSDATWKRKINAYRSYGWSAEETRLAIVREPWCMLHSEEKVREVMDILVNKNGWKSSDIALSPKVLSLSLKKRIIPRSSVMQVLFSKHLIAKAVKVSAVFYSTEKVFLEKFVVPFAGKVPYLSGLYEEQMSLSEQPEAS